jgi:putative CocE/NonD family hydrolase
MMQKIAVVFVWAWSSLAVAQNMDGSEFEFPDTLETIYHHGVEMRDGVELSTDIYLPNRAGEYPTLLVRDMYSNGATAVRQRYAKFAAANGYAFVFQSVRGRYDSEGDWYPYFQEISDGNDTLTWIAEQEWSNGKVGMFGSSYLASVQWLAAIGSPPALKAIIPAMSPGNYYRDVAYPGGAFSLLSRARWGIGLAGSRTIMSFPVDWVGGIDHLPLNTLAKSIGFDVKHFQDWLDHPTYDDYWKPLNLEARADEMSVPALNIGGWYDVFLRSTIGSYKTMTEEAASQQAREGQRLIIGPWTHGWNQTTQSGDQEFGEASLVDIEPLYLEWFNYWLKDGPEPTGAPIRIFVMGEDVWRDEYEWPLARTEYKSYFLHSDGSLSSKSPSPNSPPQTYDYDPSDPVPTLGGNIMESSLRGPYDQSPLDSRDDVIRFVTTPFAVRSEITGPIRAQIFASTSAKDTDFMAKLIVVKPDGEAFNLVDGVIRARYRDGFENPSLLKPGEIYRYDIDLWATSYVLSPGDRLRIDVSSSNFPRLNRNLNTGAPFAETIKMKIARQTIYMDEEHASRIILPLIPTSEKWEIGEPRDPK